MNEELKATVDFRKLDKLFKTTTDSVFGLYRYPAKFIPQVISFIMQRYSEPKMWVIDPFAGSGTTGLVARLYGCSYELWDLNPLLSFIHQTAITKPSNVSLEHLVMDLFSHTHRWLPAWSNIFYWYPEQIVSILSKLWGYYHNSTDSHVKSIIVLPLLKISKLFSYNDLQRQKLSRSPYAMQRVERLMTGDWQETIRKLLMDEITKTIYRLQEYQKAISLKNFEVEAVIKIGLDSLALSHQPNHREWDILITSPPYLQAHEYIRFSKLDLFWLGYSEEEIRALSKCELPYYTAPRIRILSETYEQYREQIREPALLGIYDNYFNGVLGVLGKVSERVRDYMFLFVGRASIRSQPIPIDRIFSEHFIALGWNHEDTLVDKIASRTLFKSKINPATGLADHRIQTEQLIILRRHTPLASSELTHCNARNC